MRKIINIAAAGAGDRELGCIRIDVLVSFPSVSPFPSSETNSPKNQSKRSAPKASRNGQPQKPVETISPKSQATRSAPKANRHDQPQKRGNTINPQSQVLGAQGRIFAGGKPRICALFARASGHQISSIVSYLREHLGIRAPFQKSYTFFGRVFGRACLRPRYVKSLRSGFFAM